MEHSLASKRHTDWQLRLLDRLGKELIQLPLALLLELLLLLQRTARSALTAGAEQQAQAALHAFLSSTGPFLWPVSWALFCTWAT